MQINQANYIVIITTVTKLMAGTEGQAIPCPRAEQRQEYWQAQHRATRCSLQACPLQAMAPWKLLQATQTTSVLSYTVSQHATIN